MIKLKFSTLLISVGLLFSCGDKEQQLSMDKVIAHAMERAMYQSVLMGEMLSDSIGVLPRTHINGKSMNSDSKWWCSGFYPGTLWYVYEYAQNEHIRQLAHKYTMRVEREKLTTDNHDIGFMIYCSFGNGYRLTRDSLYAQTISTACESLSARFSGHIGAIRSWDFNENLWQYPVIIDNMMNLEMLMWGANTFDKVEYKQIAVSHANKTLEHHFRDDMSCYHVISYDTLSGQPHLKQTWQGASDNSSWARGQAWALS